ncbi:MAG: methyltransferase, TIGR04325 family [Verrucomicrobia bacterium]|nr:methyltransferase, TIGR04325 family [Verrucomicrobiota bacterium]
MRGIVKALVPVAARRWWRHRFGWRWFDGDYSSWADARAAGGGYDDAAVLARAVEAARAVRAGAAAWERDGTLFTEPAVHAPLLAALRAVAAERSGRLEVVDFGGALGSTWWQHREALADLTVRWCVVEQPQFVAAGRTEFAGPELGFEETLGEACTRTAPAVILFSSVLQYVEQPHALVAEAVASGVRHVIVDRTPVWHGGRDWLAVQRTPPSLGGGGYPAWVFDRARLLAAFEAEFKCVHEWPGFDDPDPRMTYHGWHFVRKAGTA